MEILIYVVIAMILFCLGYLRFIVVVKAAEEWNYKVFRYEKYCILHNVHCDDFEANRMTNGEVLLVFVMFWKARPRYFFEHAPDFVRIDELILGGMI